MTSNGQSTADRDEELIYRRRVDEQFASIQRTLEAILYLLDEHLPKISQALIKE